MLATVAVGLTHRVHPELTLDDAVRQARAGSSEALAELYHRFAGSLLVLARHLTGSIEDAEDVVHDVFVGLPEALRRYEEHGSFEVWLRRVTLRTALMTMRRSRRRSEEQLEGFPERAELASAPEHPPDRGVWDAVAALPARLRITVVLRHVEGYTHEEAARLLGITAGATRVRYTRALQLLRDRLGEDR